MHELILYSDDSPLTFVVHWEPNTYKDIREQRKKLLKFNKFNDIKVKLIDIERKIIVFDLRKHLHELQMHGVDVFEFTDLPDQVCLYAASWKLKLVTTDRFGNFINK